MSLPYLAIIEIGQLLDAKALLRLRLVDKHWNYLFTQLYFQTLTFKKPLDTRDLNVIKKYDSFINNIHLERFDENISSLMKLTQHQTLPNLIEFSTSLPTNMHFKYMQDLSSFCRTLRQLKHLRILRITAESPTQVWKFKHIHSLSLEMDNCWDILSFLNNLQCPLLKHLTIVHSKPNLDLPLQVKHIFPNLEEFNVLPYLEANTPSISINYKANTISAVSIATDTHSSFVSFKEPQSNYNPKTGLKEDALQTLEKTIDMFADPKRQFQIQQILPTIATFHFGNYKSINHLYDTLHTLRNVPHLEFDWRIMPSLTSTLAFQTEHVTFHSQCGLYKQDMEWFIHSFPHLRTLELTHCYGEREWSGYFPKLDHLICLYASANPLHQLLKTSPNCKLVEMSQNSYEALLDEGFFLKYPMVEFKVYRGGRFENANLTQ